MPFPRPVVVLSQCLELSPCRWDGERIPFPFLARLAPFVELRPVCPEVEIGLGVPRDPIRIIQDGEGGKLLQPATGRDLTRAMRRFAGEFLGGLEDADGFILKSRSPSCGIRDAKLRGPGEGGAVLGKGAGLFAGEVLARFPGLAVEDEARLANLAIRERFLTRLFALAAFRAVREKPSAAGLARFHEANRLLLMARGRREAEALGEIAANRGGRPLPEAMGAYETRLRAALARPARRSSNINVLVHALGHLSPHLKKQEKAFFLGTLERCREGQLPLSPAVRLLRGWIARHESTCLAGQTFFAPFPAGLAEAGEEPALP